MRPFVRLMLVVAACLPLTIAPAQAAEVEWSAHTVVLDDGRSIVVKAAAGFIRLGGAQGKIQDSEAPSDAIYRAARVDVVRSASEIPLKIGTTFGVEYRISGLRQGEKVSTLSRFEFPASPDGTQLAPYDLVGTETNGEDAAAFHTFRVEEPELNLTGKWTITFFIEGKKVISHEFCVGKCDFILAAR